MARYYLIHRIKKKVKTIIQIGGYHQVKMNYQKVKLQVKDKEIQNFILFQMKLLNVVNLNKRNTGNYQIHL